MQNVPTRYMKNQAAELLDMHAEGTMALTEDDQYILQNIYNHACVNKPVTSYMFQRCQALILNH